MKTFFDTFATPAGVFSVAVNEHDAVIATAFGDLTRLCSRGHPGAPVHDPARTARVRCQILEYFGGKRTRFEVQLAPAGTDFQKRVWAELSRIPFGETRSYAEVARAIGSPNAARAVGRANATNPICLLVPCHRVIGADGSLTGFAFGQQIKQLLLDHESRLLESGRPSNVVNSIAIKA